MKRIYCDGIFDLFHMGHLNHLRQIHDHFDEPIHLIVGVISDSVATSYKRRPFVCEYGRARIIEACVYSSSSFITDVLTITEEFMNEHQIDFVVHALTENDKQTQSTFFEIPRRLNRFIELDYNVGISTTQIMKHFHTSNGSQFDPLPISRKHSAIPILEQRIGLHNTNCILEIGCEDELFGRYVGIHNYMCLDTDLHRITNFIHVTPCIALHIAPSIPMFSPKSFDVIIINTSCLGDIIHTLSILEPVARNSLYICNIIDDARLQLDKQLLISIGYTIVVEDCIGRVGYDAYRLFGKENTNIF